ncbi:MAG: Maf family protein, partial [Pontixanthobacter sp.]
GKIVWEHGASARLHVRSLSSAFIESYLDAEWPEVSHCVGVFRIEGRGVQLFDRVEGDHFTILGMPLLPVLDALRTYRVLVQ